MLAVASEDAETAAEMLKERELEGMSEVELAAAGAVIDLDADSNACPACMDPIPKGSTQCPGCGLRIG
jgi:hypothetical protein